MRFCSALPCMEHTRAAPERLSLGSNSPKYHSTLHAGRFAKDDNSICHSLKSVLKPKARECVIVQAHNKDVDESSSSELADVDSGGIVSSPYQRQQGNQLRALESYFAKLNSTGPLLTLPQESKRINGNFKNRVDLLQLQFGRGNTVLLFEIASPVKNSENEYLSLPLLYGAKINDLILSGEWWRLLTPMCLHSGFLHVALGCWVLLTFGPRVCRAYGQLSFFLIYILGGICGNLTSFVHTPEITVCGTGPVFSIIGAWLVYQSHNKQVIDKDVSESMFWQAVIAAALSFILSVFGRIDNWAHLGATISGLLFGYLTCPSIELDNAKNSQKDAVALVRRQARPCKSAAVFFISVLAFAILAFAYGIQFNNMDLWNS